MKKNNILAAVLIFALTLGFGFTITIVRAAPPIVVDFAVPDQAEQGTVNLPVIINGRGFDKNMKVKFCRSESNETCVDGGVDVIGEAEFISSKQIRVTVDVDIEADIGNFDIEAESLNSGRRGRGIEKFAVLVPATTYEVELTGRVFSFGPIAGFTEDDSLDALNPDPAMPITFTRPGGDIYPCPVAELLACQAWDAVFFQCENFFGHNPIRMGPTPIVVSEFTVPAGSWRVNKPGGVRFQMWDILFDDSGNSPPADGKDPYAQVSLQLFGDTLFENPATPWLPVPGDPIQDYPVFEFSIIGKTVKGVRPKKGCVSGGSAEGGDFDPPDVDRKLKIEAIAAP